MCCLVDMSGAPMRAFVEYVERPFSRDLEFHIIAKGSLSRPRKLTLLGVLKALAVMTGCAKNGRLMRRPDANRHQARAHNFMLTITSCFVSKLVSHSESQNLRLLMAA